MIIVETTFNKKEDAESTVNFLLEEKLIACATYKNVESTYAWEGKIENDEEILVKVYFLKLLKMLKQSIHTNYQE